MMATENKRHVSGAKSQSQGGPMNNHAGQHGHGQEHGFGPSGTVSLEKALSSAIGARIRVTTTQPASVTVEGTLFTACPITNIIAINTSSAANAGNSPNSGASSAAPVLALSQPGDFTILPITRIHSFNLISLSADGCSPSASPSPAPFASAQPSIYPLDIRALRNREASAIARLKEHESSRGKGVSKEAQDLFDAFRRTMPTHWSGTSIVVADSVVIAAPYGVGDCKTLNLTGRDEVAGTALTRVRKVLEMERKKIELRRASTAMANSGNFPKNNADASSRKNSMTTTTATGASTPATTGSTTATPAANTASTTPRDPRAAVAVPIRSNAPSSSSPSGGQRKGG
ncbi:uncharacterized protein GIQ15_03733 [Arthroderma uncinatum]|uniref:uncharacterized protein n=1 Tax=Arthroderma uncinatum TaxID=74035 RepID=UPI00144A7AEE|nr:uncharacterized protein GIQ15_03733 [Arthroderma uncinatum]KAF3484409.1 hypothetical protein GIQ15_03733 [Arthroderma uncinatum]